MAYNISKFKKGDIVKIKKGRKSSNEIWIYRIKEAKVITTYKRYMYDRCPKIKIKVTNGTSRTQWEEYWKNSQTIDVYEDCLELTYKGDPAYSIY